MDIQTAVFSAEDSSPEVTEPQADESTEAPAPTDSEARVRSLISFPYGDLDDAVEVVKALHDNYGTTAASDQLAAAMNSTPKSGSFRTKISSSRLFGVIDVGRKQITLTDLGIRLADSQQEAMARIDAFLSVELYKRLYDDFRGNKLPGDKGLENVLKELGVSPKQLNKARLAFQRSAEQAGFFAAGNDRLVMPNVTAAANHKEHEPPAKEPQRQVHRDEANFLDDLHPLLVGLIKTIPREGEEFSPRRQKQWLAAAKINFALIFGGDEDEDEPLT